MTTIRAMRPILIALVMLHAAACGSSEPVGTMAADNSADLDLSDGATGRDDAPSDSSLSDGAEDAPAPGDAVEPDGSTDSDVLSDTGEPDAVGSDSSDGEGADLLVPPDTVQDASSDLPDGDSQPDAAMVDPFAIDSDGDGAPDGVEDALGTNPADGASTPEPTWFIVPHLGAPTPLERLVGHATAIRRGDVAFLVDTTATLGGPVQALKAGGDSILSDLAAIFPELATGVAGFDDFPTGNYGTPGIDAPFYLPNPTSKLSPSAPDTVAALQSLAVHDGGDFPNSQVAAVVRALTDGFLSWDTGTLPPTGASPGTFGSLHFRTDALQVLVLLTKSSFHNGRRAISPAILHDPYSFNGAPPFPTPTIDDLALQVKARGARMVGISASSGARNGSDPYENLAWVADNTASSVPPLAFGAGGACPTGLFGGHLIVPDGPSTADAPGGTCRLVMDIGSDGSGLESAVAAGVRAAAASVALDAQLVAASQGGALDPVAAFVEAIVLDGSGAVPLDAPGTACLALDAAQLGDVATGPTGSVSGSDGVPETALHVYAGGTVCARVVPKANASVVAGPTAQVFYATLGLAATDEATGKALAVGSPRMIAFVVPPAQ